MSGSNDKVVKFNTALDHVFSVLAKMEFSYSFNPESQEEGQIEYPIVTLGKLLYDETLNFRNTIVYSAQLKLDPEIIDGIFIGDIMGYIVASCSISPYDKDPAAGLHDIKQMRTITYHKNPNDLENTEREIISEIAYCLLDNFSSL
ncbi:MAG: hypothetical protein Q9M76_00975 [Candidatus Dojkabacteria bacterium]|nr:hypothetical protein [Candidatus Dojkabacteria bacterium]